MKLLSLVLLILAVVLFIVAAFFTSGSASVALVPLGLAAFAGAFLVKELQGV